MAESKPLSKSQFEKEGIEPKEPISDKYKVEPLKDEKYKGKPIASASKTKKAAVDGEIREVQVTERYPRFEQSANYKVEVVAPVTGIPMVRISPVGWVGAPPLQIPESRLDEIIELLTKVR